MSYFREGSFSGTNKISSLSFSIKEWVQFRYFAWAKQYQQKWNQPDTFIFLLRHIKIRELAARDYESN